MENDIEKWAQEIKTLIANKNKDSDIRFHELIYNPPSAKSQIITDTIFSTFLNPFDSSVMQACITALSGCSIEAYTTSYVRILPLLLKAQPTWAVDLFDYPGKELSAVDARRITFKILESHNGHRVLQDLKSEVSHQQLDQEEPWSFITD